jgi:hypothetical protein
MHLLTKSENAQQVCEIIFKQITKDNERDQTECTKENEDKHEKSQLDLWSLLFPNQSDPAFFYIQIGGIHYNMSEFYKTLLLIKRIVNLSKRSVVEYLISNQEECILIQDELSKFRKNYSIVKSSTEVDSMFLCRDLTSEISLETWIE